MHKKCFLKRAAAAVLAAALTMNLLACQPGGKSPSGNSDESKSSVQTESQEKTDSSSQGESQASTESQSQTESQSSSDTENSETVVLGKYRVTEETEDTQPELSRRPESPYWFPEELLAWTPAEDADLKHNRSTVPLAERADAAQLLPVNETQNKETRVMALSIMNANTSGNLPHGSSSAKCNIFTYWQYVDELVYWGGSAGEGLIVPPSPDVTDLGHTNGVPVMGTVFFPQGVSGGKMEWLETFLLQTGDGKFPLADKLIEAAETYGFDGWFINQETEGTVDEPLTEEHAKKMQLFIKYFKEQAPHLRLIWYDSMTEDGRINWQNALTDQNAAFLKDGNGKPVADEMFLNFWWSANGLADEKLLEQSAKKAKELGLDPYQLYAGIDLQAKGYVTPIRWDLFAAGENSTHTSLGIYCPSWTYFSSSSLEEFHEKEKELWVNGKGDPSAAITYRLDTQWRGISTYVIEKTAVTSLPFVTNFNTGSGLSFFKEGQKISERDWNNRSTGEILPTYRWIIENEDGTELQAAFDTEEAWYGGNSLKLYGTAAKDKASLLQLYSADLPVAETTQFSIRAKADEETAVTAVLLMEDGKTERLPGDRTFKEAWTEVSFDLAACAGKRIRRISLELMPKADSDSYTCRIGSLMLADSAKETPAGILELTVEDSEFDEDAMYAGIRLAWESDREASLYEIYLEHPDGMLSFLGLSNTESCYLDALSRPEGAAQSVFAVIPVTHRQTEGEAARVTMNWPDNRLPKADGHASQTLIGVGGSVTFTSECSQNTEEVSWHLPGADKETANGETVTVVYDKEGVYDVTVTAKNAAGETEKTIEGLIVVSADMEKDAALSLLSQGKGTEATAYVNENEKPSFAVDGNRKKKWCATGTPPHALTIDLGEEALVSQVAIAHAEAGGESPDMNTKAYTISVSRDGTVYETVAVETKNAEAETLDTFAPVRARYIRLTVEKPTQGSDSAARIYEVEVYGK